MKKKLLTLAVVIAMITSAITLVACGETKFDEDKKELALTVTSSVMEITAETTLEDYMNKLQEKNDVTFEGDTSEYGLFITKINGVAAGVGEYWMLYTTDNENSSTEWGSYTWKDEVLGSATLGVSGLIVKEGETYVWVLQKY